MPLVKHITSAYLFPNGMLAAVDINGEQVGELQGLYSIEKHQRILWEATDDCELKGFHILPPGWNEANQEYADHWRKQDMSFEDVKNL